MSQTVYTNHSQRGPITVYPYVGFHADPEPPVKIWEEYIQGNCGEIRQGFDDKFVESLLLVGHNVMSTSIKSPVPPYTSLGIRLPILAVMLENIGRTYTFDVQVLDTEGGTWLFRFSNGTSYFVRTHQHCCSIPAPLRDGWNELIINVRDLTRSAYGKIYKETISLQVFSTCRLRKIQFRHEPMSMADSSTSLLEYDMDDSSKVEVIRSKSKPDSVIQVEASSRENVMGLWTIAEEESASEMKWNTVRYTGPIPAKVPVVPPRPPPEYSRNRYYRNTAFMQPSKEPSPCPSFIQPSGSRSLASIHVEQTNEPTKLDKTKEETPKSNDEKRE